jgi:hypothetical protein
VPVTEIVNHQDSVHFNNLGHANGQSFSVHNNNNHQSVEIEKLESLYREQINNLRDEVAYLRELLRKTMEK